MPGKDPCQSGSDPWAAWFGDTAKSNPTALAAGTSTSKKLAQLESQLKEDVRDAINTEMTNRQTADMGNGRIGALETAVGAS